MSRPNIPITATDHFRARNPLHYVGVACARCNGSLRYKTNRGCVVCQKLATKARRAARAGTSEFADGSLTLPLSAKAEAQLNDLFGDDTTYEDLL